MIAYVDYFALRPAFGFLIDQPTLTHFFEHGVYAYATAASFSESFKVVVHESKE